MRFIGSQIKKNILIFGIMIYLEGSFLLSKKNYWYLKSALALKAHFFDRFFLFWARWNDQDGDILENYFLNIVGPIMRVEDFKPDKSTTRLYFFSGIGVVDLGYCKKLSLILNCKIKDLLFHILKISI